MFSGENDVVHVDGSREPGWTPGFQAGAELVRIAVADQNVEYPDVAVAVGGTSQGKHLTLVLAVEDGEAGDVGANGAGGVVAANIDTAKSWLVE